MADSEIETSKTGGTNRLAGAYAYKTYVRSLADTNTDIEPDAPGLFETSPTAGLSSAEILALAVTWGITLAGLGLMIGAFFIPKAAFQRALLIGGGATLTLSAGWIAHRILARRAPRYKIEYPIRARSYACCPATAGRDRRPCSSRDRDRSMYPPSVLRIDPEPLEPRIIHTLPVWRRHSPAR